MKNNPSPFNNTDYKSLVDYLYIVKNRWLLALILFLIATIVSIAYAVTKADIYTSTSALKITQPSTNILESPFGSEFGGSQADRFIANEIETMKNITIRKKVASEIIDSFNVRNKNEDFALVLSKNIFKDDSGSLKPSTSITASLSDIVKIEQKKGLDFIQISANSPSPYESALLVNTYADVYRKFNLADNRKQVTRVKEFLEEQKKLKHSELLEAENKYKSYQLKDGTIQLDEQARSLITTMTDLETKINETNIEISIASETLNQLKSQLNKRDRTISQFLEKKATEPYLVNLQNQIAELEAQRDFAITGNSNSENKDKLVNDYNIKIEKLKNLLRQSSKDYQTTILSSSPDEVKEISNKILEEEIRLNTLKASHKELLKYLKNYQARFDELPEASIDQARIERERLAAEKIYLILEEKYQEALINEQSTEGNVLVLNYADIPTAPSGPNRLRIVLIGLVIGLVLGIGTPVFLDSLDKTIKSPDEIEDANLELLGWVPDVKELNQKGETELLVTKKHNSLATDSFKSLRTILRYSRVEGEPKVLLITSSLPSEGKTVVASNLAGSYALTRKKTVLLDCDLRRPRTHNIFNENRTPGFTDYLVGQADFDSILRNTEIDDLVLIPAGTIPPNPTEMIDSRGFKSFLNMLRKQFDNIIIDSPPISTLADALILSDLVDETILVARSQVSELEIIRKSVTSLKKLDNPTFSGVLLNGFNLEKSYGSYYYKYAYNYSRNGESKKKPSKKGVLS